MFKSFSSSLFSLIFSFFFDKENKKSQINKEILPSEVYLNKIKRGKGTFYWTGKVLFYTGVCLLIFAAILYFTMILPFGAEDNIYDLTNNSFLLSIPLLVLGWFASQLSSAFEAIISLIEESRGVI